MQTRAMAATIQGSEDAPPEAAAIGAPADSTPAPTARPQRWQNRAPGESEDSQPAQLVGSRDAPQLAQNRPLPGVEQARQTVSEVNGCVMRYNLNRVYPRRIMSRGRRSAAVLHVKPTCDHFHISCKASTDFATIHAEN